MKVMDMKAVAMAGVQWLTRGGVSGGDGRPALPGTVPNDFTYAHLCPFIISSSPTHPHVAVVIEILHALPGANGGPTRTLLRCTVPRTQGPNLLSSGFAKKQGARTAAHSMLYSRRSIRRLNSNLV